VHLKEIWLTTLARCAPEVLVRRFVDASMPRNVVAIGKCAGALFDGVAAVHAVEHAFVVVPKGYRGPAGVDFHTGGHPHMDAGSFAAGRALLAFVDAHDDILFLVSGGGSACVEVPLPPHTEQELIATNARLVASGLPIAEINAKRRELSAIKGGKLGARVKGRHVTLVWSDVSTDRWSDVASGPAANLIGVADNTTLTKSVPADIRIDEQIECDVADAALLLAARARELKRGQLLVAGGEPTVVVRGDGIGGRCSELAVRFAAAVNDPQIQALFGASDGVDGNSGAAGVWLKQATLHGLDPEPALARSDSMSIASQVGEPIMIAPTGNNLRDLFLVARD
jgi:glycerate 2-kinase